MTGERLDEQELVRALRSPGSPAELAGEESYLAMFREHGPRGGGSDDNNPGPRRTAARRIGTSVTLAAVVAVASAGVAAAYSSHLPDPLQSAAHRVLGPVGVPPVAPRRAPEQPRTVATAPPATQSPDGRESASPSSAAPSAEPTRQTPSAPRARASARPSAAPAPTTAAPAPTPSADPSTPAPPPPPPPVPASVSIVAPAGHRVAPGQMTVFHGTVSAADGTPVPDVRVVLRQRTTHGWVRVAEGRTGRDGSIELTSPPAERTTQLRFAVRKLRSAPWLLVLQPALTASAEATDGQARVRVQASGGQPGDTVQLLVKRNGQLRTVATGSLDGAGAAVLETPAPKKRKWYVVRLLSTSDHRDAQTRVAIRPG